MSAYTITGLVGLVAAFGTAFLLSIKTKLSKLHLFYLGLCSVAGIFIGGHFLYFLVGLPQFITEALPLVHSADQLVDQLFYASSGMVYFGGLGGALLFIYLYLRATKLPMRPYLNNVVITYPLFHAFGRIGCVLTGCCYGIEYHGIGAITYTQAHVTPGINDHIVDFSRFPVQPLEAFLELVIFGVLLFFLLKKGDEFPVTSTYLLLYSVVRFLDEFLRGDEIRGFWGPLSTSQWISLAIIVITVIYLIVKRNKNLKTDAQNK